MIEIRVGDKVRPKPWFYATCDRFNRRPGHVVTSCFQKNHGAVIGTQTYVTIAGDKCSGWNANCFEKIEETSK